MSHVSFDQLIQTKCQCCINGDHAKKGLVKAPLKDMVVISKKRGSSKHEGIGRDADNRRIASVLDFAVSNVVN